MERIYGAKLAQLLTRLGWTNSQNDGGMGALPGRFDVIPIQKVGTKDSLPRGRARSAEPPTSLRDANPPTIDEDARVWAPMIKELVFIPRFNRSALGQKRRFPGAKRVGRRGLQSNRTPSNGPIMATNLYRVYTPP